MPKLRGQQGIFGDELHTWSLGSSAATILWNDAVLQSGKWSENRTCSVFGFQGLPFRDHAIHFHVGSRECIYCWEEIDFSFAFVYLLLRNFA